MFTYNRQIYAWIGNTNHHLPCLKPTWLPRKSGKTHHEAQEGALQRGLRKDRLWSHSETWEVCMIRGNSGRVEKLSHMVCMYACIYMYIHIYIYKLHKASHNCPESSLWIARHPMTWATRRVWPRRPGLYLQTCAAARVSRPFQWRFHGVPKIYIYIWYMIYDIYIYDIYIYVIGNWILLTIYWPI